MRLFVSTVLTLVLSTSLVHAQDDDKRDNKAKRKGAKDAKEEKTGPNMDTADPVANEKSDKGPYSPQGKTGELKEEAETKTETEEIVKARARDKFVVFGEVIAGFGRAPLSGVSDTSDTSQETGSATAFTLIAGGAYDLSPKFTLGLRIPVTTASVKNTGRQSESSFALGNPELMGEYRVGLTPLTQLPILFGVGIPVAMGEPDPTNTKDASAQRQAAVNLIADAATGWRDGELFWPKRVPLILGVGITHERRALFVHGETKFVLGVNIGGDPEVPTNPAGEFEASTLAFRNVTGGGIRYQFLDDPAVFAGLDAWVVYNAIEPIEYTSSSGAETPSRLQLVAEPRVGARFGKISPSLGVIFPIGGRLADSGITGVRLHVDIAL
jgi:hypothetical protein